MTEIDKEKSLNNYPSPVTINETKKILRQMEKSICKIQNKKGCGTGFFCKILNIKLLITNNHVVDEEIMKNNNIIRVELDNNEVKKVKIKNYYTNVDYDATIIEIADIISVKKKLKDQNRNCLKEDDVKFEEENKNFLKEDEDNLDENINYLEIDDNIFDENIEIYNKNIYIIQYPKGINEQKAAVSYGILKEIRENKDLIHCCCTSHGSSGSPILKLSNQKIIGIHKEGDKNHNFNIGI